MTTSFRWLSIALFLVLAATVGLQRPARAGDTGAVIGGIIAGALVYDLLDDDHHRGYYRRGPSRYRTSYHGPGCYGGYWGSDYGVSVQYYGGGYSYSPPRATYHHYYNAPSRRGHDRYAPRGGHGRKYRAPRRYCR